MNIIEKSKSIREKYRSFTTPYQIEFSILNDVEYPTDYGKFCQAKLEIAKRYEDIKGMEYDIMESSIKIKILSRDMPSQKLEAELSLIEIDKLTDKINWAKTHILNVCEELKIFVSVYEAFPDFHDLAEEKAEKLERNQWSEKAKNFPLVFEERYGGRIMAGLLGDGGYEDFKKLRREGFGLLPRELFENTQIEEK